MQIMKRGRQYLPDDFFIDIFISGLIDNIKHSVQCHCPTSLLKAYWFARKIDKTNNCQIVEIRRNLPAAPRNAPIRNGPPRENQGRNARCHHQCWHCPEIYVPGHRCPNMNRAINMMIMQGYSNEEA
jgi:hypothetical protein